MREVLKVGVSGVRGIVGDSLTPSVVLSFAQAFGMFVGRGPVNVGRDTRPSGELLERAVVAGLISVGCRPVLLGVVPTPSLLFRTSARRARGAVALTASHNPAEWNALKFADRSGIFLNQQRTDELLDVYHQGGFPLVPEPELPGEVRDREAVAAHFERIASVVDAGAIRQRRFRVAVDCANGVGSLHVEALLRDLFGCEVLKLHDDPARIFERPPEPLPANIRRLCKEVRKHGCHVGFALDPDGDRLAVVDERGEALGEDLSLALELEQVLCRHERGPVVVNLTASRVVEAVAERHGCAVWRSPTGEVNVVEEIVRNNAAAGGESTGGFIFPPVHLCRDAFSAMAVVLEFLAFSGETVSEWRGRLPRFHTFRESIGCPTERAPQVLQRVRAEFREDSPDTRDGVYVSLPKAWLHVRRSNTEPVVRLTVEGADQEAARSLFDHLRGLIAREVDRAGHR